MAALDFPDAVGPTITNNGRSTAIAAPGVKIAGNSNAAKNAALLQF
jgi:hypothetical protein